jgi:adenylosuccinate synthase
MSKMSCGSLSACDVRVEEADEVGEIRFSRCSRFKLSESYGHIARHETRGGSQGQGRCGVPVTVVVGGQFGSEGKGKVAHLLARDKRAAVVVRVGGSNSGHTVIDQSGVPQVFRMLPTAAILDHTMCVLGAGSYIDVDVLLSEVGATQLSPDRLMIDPNAYVVTSDHKRAERDWSLGERIGSTQSGTGAAVVERTWRLSSRNLARNNDRLTQFIKPVKPFLRSSLQRGERVIIEGTQGFGLSLLHSPNYPKATSRDTTAAAFVAEAGLSPIDVDEVVLVTRAFPIRVAGDSGDFPNEIDWETVTVEGGWSIALTERTSVTKKIRRVARFDEGIVSEAIEVNQPTQIVLNHADYFDAASHGAQEFTRRVESEVSRIETRLGRRFDIIGLGPNTLLPRTRASAQLRIA